jgi:positive regulator of sigma E activity
MIERGSVEKLDGEIVLVRLQEQDGCESCVNHSCKDNRAAVMARNPEAIPLAEGDGVEICIEGSTQALAAFWILAVPVALLFGGYFAGRLLVPGASEVPGILGAVIGLAVGVIVGIMVQKARKHESLPRIVRKITVMLGSGESEGPEMERK